MSVFNKNGQVFAAESGKFCDDISEYSSRKAWSKRVVTSLAADGGWVTLSFRGANLRCAKSTWNKVDFVLPSGLVLLSCGNLRKGDAGYLYCPYISDDDDDGSVLIADRGNNRLQVLNKQGVFRVLQLEPDVAAPRNAVLFDGHIYVTSWDEQTIVKYRPVR